MDFTKCIGCGTCATACPSCALEAKNPTDKELSDLCREKLVANENGVLELRCSSYAGACNKAQNTNVVPDVMCMGRLDESLLIELVLCGCTKLVLHTGNCELCPHASGGALAKEVGASAKGLLSAFGKTLDIETTREPNFEKEQASNVSLIKEKTAALHENAPSFEHVNKQGTLSHYVPSRRKRLFKLMEALGKPKKAEIETRLWGEVSIDVDACKSCQMCAVFCPTGALKKTGERNEEGASLGVDHCPVLCLQCRSCESICPAGALTLSKTVQLDDFSHATVKHIEMNPAKWIPNEPDSIWKKTMPRIGGNYTAF